MNFKAIALLIVFASSMLWAQVVTTAPTYATENDEIVVYFHADRGDQGLMGYSGDDVYAHTGVITDQSNGAWVYVKTNWLENTAETKLTRLSTDLWKLNTGNPHAYYGVPMGEKILKLAFVFRNADGSRTGRDDGGADVFYTLYESGITAVFIQPEVNLKFGDAQRTPVFLNPTDTLHIQCSAAAIGTAIDSLFLLINNNTVVQTADTVLHYTFDAAGYGGNTWITTVALGSGGLRDTQSIFVIVKTPPQEAQLAPWKQDGINYDSYTSVTLSLFAPHKQFVYVIGDFNDWKVDESYKMYRDSVDASTTHYWITLDGLSPGVEYAYQYLVDGEIRIADPYADKILDPWNDQYISSATYPGLKAYPEGKTDQIVSVFQTAQETFNWRAAGYHRPAQQDLVIYELLIRDFIAAHDYATLTDTLDYLQNLGVNAIELMPVNEFDGNESWGYNPDFYFAPDKYYGPKNDFKRFIDACHERGIAVIMDMVLNHSTGQSPFVRLYNEGISGKPTPDNPWFNVESPNPSYSWFYDFNHESPETQKLVDRINSYWLTEYKIDGFRFDFTKGFTNKPGDGLAYDASRIQILERMADAIWSVEDSAYVILEHLTDNSEEVVLANYGMLLWGNTNYNYNEATMGYNDGGRSDFSWGYYGTRGWAQPNLVTYMESHDEERLMYKNLTYGNSSGAYSVKDLSTALNRMKLAGAFFFTYPGPKMVWQFGELGYEISIETNGRTGNKPLHWEYFQDINRNKLYKTWAALLKLRKENEVFRSANTTVALSVSGAVKRINLSHATMNVSIIGNFDVSERSADPNFQHTGQWFDYFSGDTLTVSDVHASVALTPGEFHIYTDKKLETPEQGILTGINERNLHQPQVFRLEQNYPNPFNPVTAISYQLSATNRVHLTVYNTLGQVVKELVNETQPAGAYTVKFDGKGLASGIYLYRLQAGDYMAVKRMLLIK